MSIRVYQEAGVPIADDYINYPKNYCAICLQKLLYCCKCQDPDFCDMCFNFHRNEIMRIAGHLYHKYGIPLANETMDEQQERLTKLFEHDLNL